MAKKPCEHGQVVATRDIPECLIPVFQEVERLHERGWHLVGFGGMRHDDGKRGVNLTFERSQR